MTPLRIFLGNTLLLEAPVHPEETLLEALQRADIALQAPCGGSGTCGKCTLHVRFRHTEQREEVLACQVAAHHVQEVFLPESTDANMAIATGSPEQKPLPLEKSPNKVGFAIDLGTTTIVCKLFDLATSSLLATKVAPNPQCTYGADVIARISAAQAGKLSQLQDVVNAALEALMNSALASVNVTPNTVSSIVLAGNTTMQSLVAGIDPAPIGKAPFTPHELFGCSLHLPAAQASGCGVDVAYFAPCIAGYVGGDITADLLALNALHLKESSLLVDIGTNGELALMHRNHIITCATAAGPVFEGANISCGMPAYAGAIAHVALNNDQLEITTINNAPAQGICGTGLIDMVALLLHLELVDETGYLLDEDEAPPSLPAEMRERLHPADEISAFWLTDTIYVTQKDIRNVQLAKAAVCAGIETLLDTAHLDTNNVSHLYIAGGFGEFLTRENAARIGLFPASLLPQAESVGNVAIDGAARILLAGEKGKQQIQNVALACSYIELSTSAFFNNGYVSAMEF